MVSGFSRTVCGGQSILGRAVTFSLPAARSDRLRDLCALAGIAAFFGVGWLLVGPGGDVPVIDDWVYAWSVQHLLETGRLQVLEFSAIYPVAQIAWGALFARVGGFSFVALRLSTVVLSIIGCWAVYLTLLELGCRRSTSLLGAFAVACDPAFFALSFSFMTDVPFVDLSAVAVFFYVSAVQRDQSSRLWIAGVWAIAAFLVRPIGIALPLIAVPALIVRRGWRQAVRRALLPIGVPVAVMAALQVGLPRALGPLDWAAIRGDQLRWWFSISLLTYLNWTIRIVLEAVFPLAPLLLAPAIGWRRALAIAAIAVLLIVPIRRARGEIPPPLPDWQTWSLQDIGARALIPGDATPSPWSMRVMPIMRGLGLLTVASLILVCLRGLFGRRRPPARSETAGDGSARRAGAYADTPHSGGGWSRGHLVVISHAAVLLGAIHALWLYNDRYYLVLAPAVAIVAASAIDNDTRAQWVAAALLVAWATIAITGTRDLLGFNAVCAAETRRLEASGVPPYEIDAGYPLNGWRLYAHPENLPPGADRRYDVPFVTGGRSTKFAMMSHPVPGTEVLRIVPLPRATWQATRELFVVKRP